MCEFCAKSEMTVEKLDTDEDEPCGWFSEESHPGTCANSAVYAVTDWFVDDHLCEAHKREIENMMAEGLGDFMESVGFSSEYEIKKITAEESCDYVDPREAGWKPCGKKAEYAKYIRDTSLVCAEHAAIMKEEFDRSSRGE